MHSLIEDVPSRIAGAGEQVLVLVGVREGSDLADTVEAAKASFPDVHVVAIGDAGNRDLVMNSLASGVASFVDENVAASALIKELELAAQGEPVISVSVLKRLLPHFSAPRRQEAVMVPATDEPEPPETQARPKQRLHLSDREAAILYALVRGASNKLIANGLQITEATVKVHIKAILRKTRLKNRTQAAIWALHHQALPKPSHIGNGNDEQLGAA